ncbi:superoxide dismutase [candidate division KSB1 bacterium]|nr:superoxide dismutase [candidate division KSB1 bacterium]
MKIIALEHELDGAQAADFKKYGADEARRVWELTQQDIIRGSYFRTDRNDAVLILECESADAAENALRTLPFVKYGLIRFELIPLKPYPGLARLFADSMG